MPNRRRTIARTVTVAAPAATVHGVLRDVESWPQYHAPAVHAAYEERGREQDTVRIWSLHGRDAVRSRRMRRTFDPSGLRITFEHLDPRPPVTAVSGGWRLTARGEDSTEVEMWHDIEVAGDEAAVERTAATIAEGTRAHLETLTATAENWKELEQRVVDFEDPLFIAGSAQDAYQVLYEADKWPERMAHVDAIDMTEDEPNVQFFDMETRTADGSSHTTRSVRLCFPHHLIVYKQIELPALLDGHRGSWTFTTTPEGVVAAARHIATIKPSALHVLGEGTTVPKARRYLRRVLSANSVSNLYVAKKYAEERADD
ncbi:aromatase/cyclase [Streptomyces sp. NPDC001388]|uniref:aromatase/cyclase n=1 Tax=Streptomyces sp. NPDC001388 TaxID=3364568 RepID=UPI003677B2AA